MSATSNRTTLEFTKHHTNYKRPDMTYLFDLENAELEYDVIAFELNAFQQESKH